MRRFLDAVAWAVIVLFVVVILALIAAVCVAAGFTGREFLYLVTWFLGSIATGLALVWAVGRIAD